MEEVVYVQVNIKRHHFGGGNRVKSIMIFPLRKDNMNEELNKLMNDLCHHFDTYLSEFNKNHHEEYDYRSRTDTAETLEFESEEDFNKALETLLSEPHKSKYLVKRFFVNEWKIMQLVNYCITLDINPPIRDKYPDRIFSINIDKGYNDKNFKEILKDKYGQFVLR